MFPIFFFRLLLWVYFPLLIPVLTCGKETSDLGYCFLCNGSCYSCAFFSEKLLCSLPCTLICCIFIFICETRFWEMFFFCFIVYIDLYGFLIYICKSCLSYNFQEISLSLALHSLIMTWTSIKSFEIILLGGCRSAWTRGLKFSSNVWRFWLFTVQSLTCLPLEYTVWCHSPSESFAHRWSFYFCVSVFLISELQVFPTFSLLIFCFSWMMFSLQIIKNDLSKLFV